MSDSIETEIDDLINNFDLKPITDGLGFHHSIKDEKEIRSSLKQNSVALNNEFETRLNNMNIKTEDTSSVNMGELAPFYADNTEVKPEVEQVIDLASVELEETIEDVDASLPLRFCAWFIDLSILLTTLLVTFTSIIYFSDLPMEIINIFMISDELFMSFTCLSLMFYTFYFSFFDKTSFSSIGKRVLNLKVVGIKGNISLIQAFTRVCLTLVSIALLGLPLILKMQDRMTDTRVVNN
jgi:hypothetical protein